MQPRWGDLASDCRGDYKFVIACRPGQAHDFGQLPIGNADALAGD